MKAGKSSNLISRNFDEAGILLEPVFELRSQGGLLASKDLPGGNLLDVDPDVRHLGALVQVSGHLLL